MRNTAKPGRAVIGVGLVVVTALLAGCGSQVRQPATATLPTSLPLQQSVPPPLGRAVQPRVQHATRLAVTPHQARVLAAECADAAAIVDNGGCRQVLEHLRFNCRPGTTFAGLCALFAPLGDDNVLFQIVDERPGTPLCAAGPAGLCFQLAVQQTAIPEHLLASLAKATSQSSSAGVPLVSVNLPTPGGVLTTQTGTPVTGPVPAAPTGVPTPTP